MTYNNLNRRRIRLSATDWMIWLVSLPFVWLYKLTDLVFDLKKRGAANNLKRLSIEVESECSELFAKYGGRILPEHSSGDPSFDFATVVCEVGSLQLRAVRDRGFTSWEISASRSYRPWEPLESACRRFTTKADERYSPIHLLSDHFLEIEQFMQQQTQD